MIYQLSHPKRSPIRVTRRTIEISALVAAMGVVVAMVPPIAGSGDSAVARLAHDATPQFSRLSAVPSHNGVYQASLVPSAGALHGMDSREWTIEVRTSLGTPVEGATLVLESAMPDDDRVPVTRPRVTEYLGDGRYRVEGLRLDRYGWWNVSLQVAAPGGVDSLAFNVVR